MLERFATHRERTWRELLRDASGRSLTFVGVGEAARVEGFCALSSPSRDDHADERTAEIAATYVDPGRSRSGVGAALLEAGLARVRVDGYEQITLWVFAANDRAGSFYRTFGFEPTAARTATTGASGLVEIRLRACL